MFIKELLILITLGGFFLIFVYIPSFSSRFFLQSLQIKTLLDAPCGDGNWINKVDLSGITYIGADIVPEIIETNKDLLDWLKFAQSETDGINLGLASSFADLIASVARGRQGGSNENGR